MKYFGGGDLMRFGPSLRSLASASDLVRPRLRLVLRDFSSSGKAMVCRLSPIMVPRDSAAVEEIDTLSLSCSDTGLESILAFH